MAISLVIIALSFMSIAGGSVFMVLFLHKQITKLKTELSKVRDEALIATRKVKGEVEGFVELSAEARAKVRGAIDTVETRLQDLDALVEVLQEEAEETALDVASFVRTTRRAGGVLGAARRMLARRRSAAD